MTESIHISEHIARSAADVYAYASQLANLPAWAAGVTADMDIRFEQPNTLGVLDHWATVDGKTYYNPMRVIADGEDSEVVFTLRNPTDADHDAIVADLATLKRILEG
jgi:hypothetical protein